MKGINNLADINKIYTPDREYHRGEIYFIADSNNTTGSEQRGNRPGLIIGNDVGNLHSPVVLVVYVTSKAKKTMPTHVELNGLPEKSIALCEQIDTVCKERLREFMGVASEKEMREIDKALAVSISLKAPKLEVNAVSEAFDANSELLIAAQNRIGDITDIAQKINYVDKILTAGKASSGIGFLSLNEDADPVRIDSVLDIQVMEKLKHEVILYIDDAKRKREEMLMRLLGLKVAKEPVSTNVDKAQDSPKPPVKPQKAKDKQKSDKRVYLTGSVKAKIEALYLDGKEMEDIAVELGIDIVKLSQWLNKSGLPEQRYKGQKIPSSGSAAILSATANLSGKRK